MKTMKKLGYVYSTLAVVFIASVVTAVVIMSNTVYWTNNVTSAPNITLNMGPTMGHESNYLGDSMQYQYTNAHYYATFVGYTDSMTPLSSPYLSFSVNENGMVPYDMYAIYSINGMGWNVLPIGSGYMTTDCTIDLSGYSISSMSTITIDVDVVYSMTTSFYWSVTLNGSI